VSRVHQYTEKENISDSAANTPAAPTSRRTAQRCGLGAGCTRSVAMVIVRKSLVNSRSTISMGEIAKLPVSINPRVRKTTISNTFSVLFSV
jgi:hypothetical protein